MPLQADNCEVGPQGERQRSRSSGSGKNQRKVVVEGVRNGQRKYSTHIVMCTNSSK